MASNNDRPLRIAFTHLTGKHWIAGNHYLKNLFLALRQLNDGLRPEILLLTPYQATLDSYRDLCLYADQVLHMPPPPRSNFWQRQMIRIHKRVPFWPTPSSPLASYLHKHQVDALFSSIEFGPRFSVPLLAWIQDFQHMHLPEAFSPQEIQTRNDIFSQIAKHADRVILSSHDARRDFERFAPQAGHKARVLPFIAQIPEATYDSDPSWVCGHYHLPQRFFYLPNQFWKHKNHRIVIQALALVHAQHPQICVVCTGSTNDYRDPLYFAELLATISTLGLRNNMILLGFIPHTHVFQLMRQSLAILQPSLFEGWSTTVEEAKSTGKRIILSDIPVHQEQAPPQATFFDPGAPESLAKWLVRMFHEEKPGPNYELEALARKQLPARTREFAHAFIETVREVVKA